MSGSLDTNPSENINWRRHKNACPSYRERWFPGNDVARGEPMYQVFCLKGTPPVTRDEQERCFHSKSACWRLAKSQDQAAEEEINSDASYDETEKAPRKRRRAS